MRRGRTSRRRETRSRECGLLRWRSALPPTGAAPPSSLMENADGLFRSRRAASQAYLSCACQICARRRPRRERAAYRRATPTSPARPSPLRPSTSRRFAGCAQLTSGPTAPRCGRVAAGSCNAPVRMKSSFQPTAGRYWKRSKSIGRRAHTNGTTRAAPRPPIPSDRSHSLGGRNCLA